MNTYKLISQGFNITNFMEEVGSDVIRDKIVACIQKEGDNIEVYTKENFTDAELLIVKDALVSHRKTEKPSLRVHRVLPLDFNPLYSDFTILGFRKKSPSYSRGKKTKAQYMCIEKDEIIVEKIFNDIRDVNGILKGVEIIFNFYDEENNIGATKTEQVASYNKAQAKTVERSRRYKQFDYMIAGAEGTPIEPHIHFLFQHYKDFIYNYKTEGSSGFANQLIQDSQVVVNPNMSAEEQALIIKLKTILSIEVPRLDDPSSTISVLNSILYQIGAIQL